MPRIKGTKSTSSFFTPEQLNHFGAEFEQSGSFEKLMVKKQALVWDGEGYAVVRYVDHKQYQRQFIVGVYANALFLTNIPYRFWEQMLMEWRGLKADCKMEEGRYTGISKQ